MHTWVKRIHQAEDALLVALLSAMILLASTQILLRNLFDYGFVWIDPFLRVLVLWLGLLGATVATRNNKHIRIDLMSRFFKRNTHRLIQSIIGQISAWTCLVIAWHGLSWIQMDYADEMVSFSGIPAWVLEAIVPSAFGLIGLRYFILSLRWGQLYVKHRKAEARASK
ncbi:MAG: TRAP transporter small permease subunit [Gammaproteobacteria bacterium]|nr:TRAP transporter small permease subunit [Gammaproteobacteria bacterium]